MKIISISTTTTRIPNLFIVGDTPKIVKNTHVDVGGPVIKSIVFFQEGAYSQLEKQTVSFKAFVGPCYIVSFVDSNIKRIIPMSIVEDVGVESDSEKKTISKAIVDNIIDETHAIPAE